MDTKAGVHERIKALTPHLLEMSHRIHAHPELGFEEERACGWLAESLTDAGFRVEIGICNLFARRTERQCRPSDCRLRLRPA